MVDSAADRRRTEDDSILTEWKSDISTSGMPIKKGPRTTEYDKQKGNFKTSVYIESYSSVGYLSFFSFFPLFSRRLVPLSPRRAAMWLL